MDWLSCGTISLGMFLADRPDRLIGQTDLSEIKGSPYNSCELGFSIDQELTGQGLMLESLSMLLHWLITQLGMQRISAHYLPENDKSAHLLQILGFEKEGIQLNALGPVGDRQKSGQCIVTGSFISAVLSRHDQTHHADQKKNQ